MDWIEDADLFIKTHTTSPRDVYEEAKRVVRSGIEEVRALRKERDELKKKVLLADEAFTAHDTLVTELRNQIEQLEKERDELRERVARLERAHFIPDKNLRDEFAHLFALEAIRYEWVKHDRCSVADIAEMSYEFATAMMEARKK